MSFVTKMSNLLLIILVREDIKSPESDFNNPPHSDANNIKSINNSKINNKDDDNTDLSSTDRLSLRAAAEKAWQQYLRVTDSIISDIFAGQLQSSVMCLTCNHRYLFIFLFVYVNYALFSRFIFC